MVYIRYGGDDYGRTQDLRNLPPFCPALYQAGAQLLRSHPAGPLCGAPAEGPHRQDPRLRAVLLPAGQDLGPGGRRIPPPALSLSKKSCQTFSQPEKCRNFPTAEQRESPPLRGPPALLRKALRGIRLDSRRALPPRAPPGPCSVFLL